MSAVHYTLAQVEAMASALREEMLRDLENIRFNIECERKARKAGAQMNYARSSEPSERPLLPKREGFFEMEECSLAIDGGEPKFFAVPDMGPVPVMLGLRYVIDEGESEPDSGSRHWFWRGHEGVEWELMDFCPLELAADALFDHDPKVKERFSRWDEEHSKPVLPRYQSVFELEMQRTA